MPQIGVAAYSGEPSTNLIICAKDFVETLYRECRDCTLVLGGYRGLMKHVVDYAISKGLRVVLVIPREYEGDEYPRGVAVVRTGMDPRARSAILVRSSDVVVALGGGIGTIVEVFIAYGLGIPVVVIHPTGLPLDRVREAYPTGVIDERFGKLITYTTSCSDAARIALNYASRSK